MSSNLERYRKDLTELHRRAEVAVHSLYVEVNSLGYWRNNKRSEGMTEAELDKLEAELLSFPRAYHRWYSEALVLVKQLLPDRVKDFVGLYEIPSHRPSCNRENYRIADACANRSGPGSVTPMEAMPLLREQIAIFESAALRLESSLFDMRQLVQADLFDSEIDAARELFEKGFGRAAGAVAGVVLEGHLKEVCASHNLTPPKAHPTINDFNQALKGAEIVDVPDWRLIQRLGDIRNKCDHPTKEPTKAQIEDLIDGAEKITKTVF